MKTLEEELEDILFDAANKEYMPDLNQYNRRQRLLKRAIAAHQAEMDRVVKELLKVRIKHQTWCMYSNFKVTSCYCTEEEITDKQRARYKAIKEGK